MRVQELEVKVANAVAKVEKCKATITRHETQLAKKVVALEKKGITLENMNEKKWVGGTAGTGGSEHYWDICEVERKQDDIKGATRKLKDAEKALSNWQEKLDVEIEKDRFLSENAPAVIVEFLNQWKELAREWFIRAHSRYIELSKKLEAAKKDAEARFIAENPGKRLWGLEYNNFMKKDKEVNSICGAINMLGGAVITMSTYHREDERLAWLERTLEADRKAKLFDLINRINAVVGTITDAAHLRISEKGNLDGTITGDKGKARIQTIGAGGWNIQIFHYRTLVHKI